MFQAVHVEGEMENLVLRKSRRERMTIRSRPRNLSQPIVAAFAKTRNRDKLHAGAGRVGVGMADAHDRGGEGPVVGGAHLERDRLAGTRAPGIAIADD
jgi:hypothetical protein